jgi:hypothetical protein
MSSELDKELQARAAQVIKPCSPLEPDSLAPQNPDFESLGDFQPSTKPSIRADYESFGFGKLLFGVAVFFLACVSLAALAMWAQGKLKLRNGWIPDEIATTEEPREHSAPLQEAELKETAKPEMLSSPFQAGDYMRWVRIGEIPPSVSPVVPSSIGKSFAPTPLSDSEAKQFADKIVAAINNNSSKEFTALMDAEVTGNYLFQHANLPPEKRFQLGSEALELYANHSRLSEQLPDAQSFPPIQMGQSSVPLIRVCNNAYLSPMSADRENGIFTTMPGARPPNFKYATDELMNEYDRIRLVVHNQLPIRFRRTTLEERSKDLRFQRTPLNMLLDHSALYFAVITTRNRAGAPVLVDLACVNQDLCLLETTWNSIDENTQKKSFDCSRPSNQTEKYFRSFRASVGDKTVTDIFKANIAFSRTKIPRHDVSAATGFLEEYKMPQPSADDCLDALEDLDRLFPNDKHNIMVRYLTSRNANFAKKASQLFDKMVVMKYCNIAFYDEAVSPYRRSQEVAMVKRIVDAFDANCLR